MGWISNIFSDTSKGLSFRKKLWKSEYGPGKLAEIILDSYVACGIEGYTIRDLQFVQKYFKDNPNFKKLLDANLEKYSDKELEKHDNLFNKETDKRLKEKDMFYKDSFSVRLGLWNDISRIDNSLSGLIVDARNSHNIWHQLETMHLRIVLSDFRSDPFTGKCDIVDLPEMKDLIKYHEDKIKDIGYEPTGRVKSLVEVAIFTIYKKLVEESDDYPMPFSYQYKEFQDLSGYDDHMLLNKCEEVISDVFLNHAAANVAPTYYNWL